MNDFKSFGASLVTQAAHQIKTDLDKERGLALLASLDASWALHCEVEAKLRTFWYKQRAELRAVLGLPSVENRRGPKPAQFRVEKINGSVPNQIRKGAKELAGIFGQGWAQVINKSTETLRERFPENPEKWFIEHQDYRIFRIS